MVRTALVYKEPLDSLYTLVRTQEKLIKNFNCSNLSVVFNGTCIKYTTHIQIYIYIGCDR